MLLVTKPKSSPSALNTPPPLAPAQKWTSLKSLNKSPLSGWRMHLLVRGRQAELDAHNWPSFFGEDPCLSICGFCYPLGHQPKQGCRIWFLVYNRDSFGGCSTLTLLLQDTFNSGCTSPKFSDLPGRTVALVRNMTAPPRKLSACALLAPMTLLMMPLETSGPRSSNGWKPA